MKVRAKKSKYSIGSILKVTWIDPCRQIGTWEDKDEGIERISDSISEQKVTVGKLVKIHKDYLVLTFTESDDGMYAGIIGILKVNIVGIKVLERMIEK